MAPSTATQACAAMAVLIAQNMHPGQAMQSEYVSVFKLIGAGDTDEKNLLYRVRDNTDTSNLSDHQTGEVRNPSKADGSGAKREGIQSGAQKGDGNGGGNEANGGEGNGGGNEANGGEGNGGGNKANGGGNPSGGNPSGSQNGDDGETGAMPGYHAHGACASAAHGAYATNCMGYPYIPHPITACTAYPWFWGCGSKPKPKPSTGPSFWDKFKNFVSEHGGCEKEKGRKHPKKKCVPKWKKYGFWLVMIIMGVGEIELAYLLGRYVYTKHHAPA